MSLMDSGLAPRSGNGPERVERPDAFVVPEGFAQAMTDTFIDTVGPVYVRLNAQRTWDIACRALPRHGNCFGGVHGGMLATLVDYALGFNLLKDGPADVEGLRLGTVSLNIDFVSGARMGEWLVVSTFIDKRHGRLRFCSCAMHADDGRLVLRASAVLSASQAR